MTSISLENMPQNPSVAPNVVAQGIALLALGFAIGYVVFGNPNWGDQTLAPVSYDSTPLANEDWHGNVRRSVPAN